MAALTRPAAGQVFVPEPGVGAARPVAALRFLVTYDGSISERYSGRVYVMLSTSDRSEPRFGPAWRNTAPFFARDVEDWKPDTPLVFDEEALGFPGPPGTVEPRTYWIQAVMRRNPDSPSIGTGQGTAVSAVLTRELDGPTGGEVVLRIDRLIGDQPFAETEDIKLIETRSDLLSDFYGRDVMLRASVILPPGYDDTDRRYPALYFIGGFGSDHTLAPYVKNRFAALAGAQRVCLVVPDPLCYTGHHAFADSDNNGPRGRALVEELIPALERELRLVAAPTARFLTGVSSGGWSSLWLQVSQPDFFGGVWSVAPDPVDFRAFQLIDIYAPGTNAYFDEHGKPRPIMRMREQVMMWYEPFARLEWVRGAGGQLGSFEAVFSPRDAKGQPALLFDRETGAVDPAVAETWKRYDIRLILEENWDRLAPKLAGKVSVFVGDRDNFYLEAAVELLKAWQASAGADIVVEIVPGRNHMNLLGPELRQRIVTELLNTFDRHHGEGM
jgi:S-formylglutathione hydrolase FrmB